MTDREIARTIRHIATRLGGAVICVADGAAIIDATEANTALEALHDLAEEIDPGGEDDLAAYVDATPECAP